MKNRVKWLDRTWPTPEQNLACDEALLDGCEGGEGPEVLRFWESNTCFVVLGCANRCGTEADLNLCGRENIPVLRRCSGGGTVVQGPGCVNYSLILRIDSHAELEGITQTNAFIMGRQAAAIRTLVDGTIAIRGATDLTWNGLKFSGNAQRRRRQSVLFHGSFLLDFRLEQIERFLPMPSLQPDYRQNRTHREFLVNLGIDRDRLKTAIRGAWGAVETCDAVPQAAMEALASEKYGSPEWNRRY